MVQCVRSQSTNSGIGQQVGKVDILALKLGRHSVANNALGLAVQVLKRINLVQRRISTNSNSCRFHGISHTLSSQCGSGCGVCNCGGILRVCFQKSSKLSILSKLSGKTTSISSGVGHQGIGQGFANITAVQRSLQKRISHNRCGGSFKPHRRTKLSAHAFCGKCQSNCTQRTKAIHAACDTTDNVSNNTTRTTRGVGKLRWRIKYGSNKPRLRVANQHTGNITCGNLVVNRKLINVWLIGRF